MTRRAGLFRQISLGLLLAACAVLCNCGGAADTTSTTTGSTGTTGTPSNPSTMKSAKRGIAYDLADPADFAALSPGVSWWYNWSPQPNTSVPANYESQYAMDFYPMLWNGNFNSANVVAFLKANPSIQYILVLNEPNLTDQANLTPQQAAQLWPQYEAVAAQTGVKIVGPAITWGTMANYQDPVAWLDAFYATFQAANARDPQIDYLAFLVRLRTFRSAGSTGEIQQALLGNGIR
jgi:putative glycosyl hydrolase